MRVSELDSKERTFLIVALLYVTYIVFPLLEDMIAIPVWMPSLFSTMLFFVLYPAAFNNKVFYWFVVYAAILFLYLLVGKPLTIGIGSVEDNKKILIEFAYILPTISIFSILNYLQNNLLNKYLIVTSLVILYASFIVTVPIMLTYQSIRSALSESETMTIAGLPSYSLMHAYALLLPIFCCLFKFSDSFKRKLVSFFLLIVLCYIVYSTFVTTSLLVMFFVLVFTFFYKENSNVIIWFSIITILFVILWKCGFMTPIIDWMIPAFEGTPAEDKLLDIRSESMGIVAENGTIDGRMNLHEISISSFFQNPLWGTSVVGEHSSLLDRFGGMGLLGGMPFLMMFISFIKYMRVNYRTELCKIFFYVGVVCTFVFLYEKGNFGCESMFMSMVLMPYSILVLENSHMENVLSGPLLEE